jgi:hypothetical protein
MLRTRFGMCGTSIQFVALLVLAESVACSFAGYSADAATPNLVDLAPAHARTHTHSHHVAMQHDHPVSISDMLLQHSSTGFQHTVPPQDSCSDRLVPQSPMAVDYMFLGTEHTATQSGAIVPRTAEEHVYTLVNGLRNVVEAMLGTEAEEKTRTRLVRIFRKLTSFCMSERFEHQLALHTASKLVELSSGCSKDAFGYQHERVMQVPCHATSLLYRRQASVCNTYLMRRRSCKGTYIRSYGSHLGPGVRRRWCSTGYSTRSCERG